MARVLDQLNFPHHEWHDEVSAEDRAATYMVLGVLANSAPEQLTEEEWQLLGASQQDAEGRQLTNQIVQQGNGVIPDLNTLMEGAEVAAANLGDGEGDVWSSASTMLASGARKPPPLQGNVWAELVFDVTTILATGGIGALGTIGAARGAVALGRTLGSRFAATRAGSVMSSVLGRVARSETAAARMAQALGRGAVAGSPHITATGYGLWAGASITDVVMAFNDPQAIEQIEERNILQAELERQGFQFREAGTAAGSTPLGSEDQVIYKDGKVYTWDQAIAEAGLEDTTLAPELREDIETADQEAGQMVLGEGEQAAGAQQASTPTTQTGEVDMAAAFAGADQVQDDDRPTMEEQWIARWQADPYLGVPMNYRRWGWEEEQEFRRDNELTRHMPDDMFEGRMAARYEPMYHQSSPMDEISNWDFKELLAFQERAVSAGFIDEERKDGVIPFRYGAIDANTITALSEAMIRANVEGHGKTYDDILDEQIEAMKDIPEEIKPAWSPSRAYMAPDYATTSQRIKSLFSRDLGRDPNDWEMQMLADQFADDHRAQYNAEMAGERSAWEARGRASETGEVNYPGQIQAIDPVARMAEKFDAELAPEMNARDRWADVQSKSRNLFGSFDRLSRA